MIGEMIAKVRKEKRLTKTELAKLTGINIGHLTHIEKGERNPSHKALKLICKALDIPYQQLMYTYDKTITEEQSEYNLVKHISYNKILAINSVEGFIDCPSNIPSSSIALKINDESMNKSFDLYSYAYIEFNTPLNPNDIGLFSYNYSILIRKFSVKNGNIVLKSENKNFPDIKITSNDKFFIIGKVLR